MAYTPPAGNAVPFVFTVGGYLVPAGNAVAFVFGTSPVPPGPDPNVLLTLHGQGQARFPAALRTWSNSTSLLLVASTPDPFVPSPSAALTYRAPARLQPPFAPQRPVVAALTLPVVFVIT